MLNRVKESRRGVIQLSNEKRKVSLLELVVCLSGEDAAIVSLYSPCAAASPDADRRPTFSLG